MVGIVVTYLMTLLLRASGSCPRRSTSKLTLLVRFISDPDFFSVYVALAAGIVGMLSLTTAKSSVLVGVLISVDDDPRRLQRRASPPPTPTGRRPAEPTLQLLLNLVSIFVAGLLTLLLQRRLYVRRRLRHLSRRSPAEPAGLPIGSSRRALVEPPRGARGRVAGAPGHEVGVLGLTGMRTKSRITGGRCRSDRRSQHGIVSRSQLSESGFALDHRAAG